MNRFRAHMCTDGTAVVLYWGASGKPVEVSPHRTFVEAKREADRLNQKGDPHDRPREEGNAKES